MATELAFVTLESTLFCAKSSFETIPANSGADVRAEGLLVRHADDFPLRAGSFSRTLVSLRTPLDFSNIYNVPCLLIKSSDIYDRHDNNSILQYINICITYVQQYTQ